MENIVNRNKNIISNEELIIHKKSVLLDEFYQLMHTGTPLVIETHGKEKTIRANSTFIGYLKHKFLIIDFPSNGKAQLNTEFTEGDELILKGVTDSEFKDILGFRATIAGVIGFPYPLILLDIPSKIQLHQARRAPRIKADIPVRIMIDDFVQPATQLEIMRDFSITGCFIALNRIDFNLVMSSYLTIGERVGVKLTTPLGADVVFYGNVVKIAEHGELVALSLQFEDNPSNFNYKELMKQKQDLFNQLFVMMRNYDELTED